MCRRKIIKIVTLVLHTSCYKRNPYTCTFCTFCIRYVAFDHHVFVNLRTFSANPST